MSSKSIGYTILGIAFIGGSIYALAQLGGRGSPLQVCVNHTGTGSHIHTDLQVIIDGNVQQIPANVGIGGTCMRPVHTHDASGKIHVEFPSKHDFTLGDFFTLWAKPFDATHLMDKVVDDTHEIIMTVNGQPSNDFRNHVIRDEEKITLQYQTKQTK